MLQIILVLIILGSLGIQFCPLHAPKPLVPSMSALVTQLSLLAFSYPNVPVLIYVFTCLTVVACVYIAVSEAIRSIAIRKCPYQEYLGVESFHIAYDPILEQRLQSLNYSQNLILKRDSSSHRSSNTTSVKKPGES